ncbi:hypothetical protein D1AOALGA4SA_5198 [Olavius algarvensis Delta 1 endosymbiont]|nr:hypothetical protein D1AOALGA4SA_5198 [Olavius algarvensis Delta 1 endosymbiont]
METFFSISGQRPLAPRLRPDSKQITNTSCETSGNVRVGDLGIEGFED